MSKCGFLAWKTNKNDLIGWLIFYRLGWVEFYTYQKFKVSFSLNLLLGQNWTFEYPNSVFANIQTMAKQGKYFQHKKENNGSQKKSLTTP